MLRRLLLAILIVAGTALIYRGGHAWYSRHQATEVVSEYLDANRHGDRDRALATLDGPLQKAVVARYPVRADWPHACEFDFRIMAIEAIPDKSSTDGPDLRIQARIQQDTYLLHPWFLLRKNDTGNWHIVGIDGGEVDPLWLAEQDQRGRDEGQRLATEIGERLEGLEGVEVDRY